MKKYGRTYHLPISPGAGSDDKIMEDISELMSADLIVTEKMDGENTTIHHLGTHARSVDSRHHSSRDWLKAFASGISPQLSVGERIVGEYLFARHSIGYDRLPSYFLGFAWIVDDEIRSWDDTMDRFAAIGVAPVSELYRGPYRRNLFEDLAATLDPDRQEGFVARTSTSFAESDMTTRMGKYVRAGHVQEDKHWLQKQVIKNGLA